MLLFTVMLNSALLVGGFLVTMAVKFVEPSTTPAIMIPFFFWCVFLLAYTYKSFKEVKPGQVAVCRKFKSYYMAEEGIETLPYPFADFSDNRALSSKQGTCCNLA